jgi:alpha-mannosidase
MYDESKSGELPKKFSFIKIEPENVFINVFKKSERDNSLILRIYEAKGIDSDYKIEFFKEIKKVEKVSLTEDEVYGILNFEKNKIKDKISKWEIITLKIEFKEEQK